MMVLEGYREVNKGMAMASITESVRYPQEG